MTRRLGLLVAVGAYALSGAGFISYHAASGPFEELALQDFHHYQVALDAVRRGGDPYVVRKIGSAYLYPPQALLWVSVFDSLPAGLVRMSTFWFSSLALVVLMVLGSARHVARTVPWWLWPIALLYAPLWFSSYLGQINIMVAFLIWGYFVLLPSRPTLAGALLAAAVALKLTPGLLLILALRHRWRAVTVGFLTGSAGLAVVAGLAFGFEHYVTYVDVVSMLMEVESYRPRQSMQSVFYLVSMKLTGGFDSPQLVQGGVWCAALAASIIVVWRHRAPRDEVLCFAVVSLALTASPNLLWYHHYLFILPALVFMLLAPPRGVAAFAPLWLLAGLQLLLPNLPMNWVGVCAQGTVWGGVLLLIWGGTHRVDDHTETPSPRQVHEPLTERSVGREQPPM